MSCTIRERPMHCEFAISTRTWLKKSPDRESYRKAGRCVYTGRELLRVFREIIYI